VGERALPADEHISWLDRISLPHLNLLRKVRIGRHRALMLAERKGRKSIVFSSNVDGNQIQTMTLEEAWTAAKILSGENPGPGTPLSRWERLFGLRGTSILAGDRLDVLFNPMGKYRYSLFFRGPEGRVAYELDASEAENFVAVLSDMKGDDNWETTAGQSTGQ
jgi:hypothetical protein